MSSRGFPAVAAALLCLAAPAPLPARAGEPPPTRESGPVGAIPGYARYITVQGGRPGTVSQLLLADDGVRFAVTGVESPLPHLAVAWREARPEERIPEAAGSQWVVETALAPDAPVGPLGAVVAVLLDHPSQRTLLIPVTGFVRPRFAVTPPEAALGAVSPGSGPFRFFVRNFMEEASELGAATCDVAGVTAVVEPAEPGHGWWVVVKIGAALPAGPFTGTLRVPTTSAGQPLLEVPVTGSGPADGGGDAPAGATP